MESSGICGQRLAHFLCTMLTLADLAFEYMVPSRFRRLGRQGNNSKKVEMDATYKPPQKPVSNISLPYDLKVM